MRQYFRRQEARAERFATPKSFGNNFTDIASNLWQKKENNQTPIRTLAALCDTLLPKLMNGEVIITGS